jgi:hypothetical protein
MPSSVCILGIGLNNLQISKTKLDKPGKVWVEFKIQPIHFQNRHPVGFRPFPTKTRLFQITQTHCQFDTPADTRQKARPASTQTSMEIHHDPFESQTKPEKNKTQQ